MIINGKSLLEQAPILGMEDKKIRENGFSYGLGEAGYDIRIKESVFLTSHTRFKLASAVEEFNMPQNLVAIVHDKSTWARRGLSVFNTVIEPGWRGFLTLELVYHGNETLQIPEGTGIAQVMFHEIKEKISYEGKYQDQETGPQEARFQ